ncbi:histone cluster 1, H4d [Mycena filopes]|nr:histone cluster 1, H4d [Mycena filopes]
MPPKHSRGGLAIPRRAAPNGPPQPRRRRISRHSLPGIGVGNKPTIKRLARRGGVKRMAGFIYEETRGCFFPYVQALVQASVVYAENSYRTTITAADVTHALRRSGRTLYGFDA